VRRTEAVLTDRVALPGPDAELVETGPAGGRDPLLKRGQPEWIVSGASDRDESRRKAKRRDCGQSGCLHPQESLPKNK